MQVHVSVNIGIGHVVNPLYLKWGIQIFKLEFKRREWKNCCINGGGGEGGGGGGGGEVKYLREWNEIEGMCIFSL